MLFIEHLLFARIGLVAVYTILFSLRASLKKGTITPPAQVKKLKLKHSVIVANDVIASLCPAEV